MLIVEFVWVGAVFVIPVLATWCLLASVIPKDLSHSARHKTPSSR